MRVDPSFKLAIRIDTDEGNAANVKTGAKGYIDGIQNQGIPRAAQNFDPSHSIQPTSHPKKRNPNQRLPTMSDTSSAKNDNRIPELPSGIESSERRSIGAAFLIRDAVIGAAKATTGTVRMSGARGRKQVAKESSGSPKIGATLSRRSQRREVIQGTGNDAGG